MSTLQDRFASLSHYQLMCVRSEIEARINELDEKLNADSMKFSESYTSKQNQSYRNELAAIYNILCTA